jgi:ABC-type Fe3+/spermidine/putrescine transport system ATPase subunit
MSLLEVQSVSKSIKGVEVVQGIDFSVPHGRKTGIAGETGSGKTTLLRMIGGWVQPDEGRILLEGRKVLGPEEKLYEGFPGIAYLSQHFELRNNYWVYEVLEYANKLSNSEAAELYALCRIDHLLKRRTHELSGGERQRIALARLLSGAPRLLLLDEPFSNLDGLHRTLIRQVLFDISEKLDITTIMVSHDAPDLLSWSDHILLMRDGQIIQEGSPEALYRHPIDPYAAGLLGDHNLLEEDWIRTYLPKWSVDGPVILRPEQVIVQTENLAGLPGTIVRTLFHGSYIDVDVRIGDKILLSRSMDTNWAVGKRVFVSFRSASNQ